MALKQEFGEYEEQQGAQGGWSRVIKKKREVSRVRSHPLL
jgi:hypothetical protein